MVGGGGLVVSPIQLLANHQGFKVINQPNGLTTIELSPQSNKFSKLFLKFILILNYFISQSMDNNPFAPLLITFPPLLTREICKSY